MDSSLFKLTSLNLNGIRSATTKGAEAWIEATAPDCICVQEIKAQASDMAGRFEVLAGMKGYFHFAEKKGYSGVGVYTRHEPSDVVVGFDIDEFDAEGRYVETRFDTPGRKFSIISAYFPSGSSGELRQEAKFRFLAKMHSHLMHLKAERDFVLCGDINIAHQKEDLKNWRGNQKNSGFLPEERDWMTSCCTRPRSAAVWWTSIASSSPTPRMPATHGGAIGARPMPTTWDGDWTTTWPHRRSRPWRAPSPSTRARSSRTTRPSPLVTTWRSEARKQRRQQPARQ
jgi:exodeoxyribonuclease III